MLQKNSAHSCSCWSVWSSLHLFHLCVTSLHVPQRYFWIDRMTTRHTKDLQVCVITVAFIHLQRNKRDVNERSTSLVVFLTSSVKWRGSRGTELTSSSCWTACCLALAMMPSSSWKRLSISVRRSRAFCCSRRMRSSCFLPCSSAMQGLCCHCWMRWGRIS